MADKVKPLKIEDSTSGTQNDGFPVETNPAQDYLAAKGVAFENNDNRLMDLDGSGNVQFKDATETAYMQLWKLRRAIYEIFDPGVSGFVSTNSNAAIIEAYTKGQAYTLATTRFTAMGSEGGNVNATKYLSYSFGNPSNSIPFVWPRGGYLAELSISTNGVSTGTYTIYKNGVATSATISLSAASSAYVNGLSVAFAIGDAMSCALTSGSGNSPQLTQFGVFTA